MADARRETTTPAARAQLARAWDVLEERKRILRMKPKPKDVDVTKAARARQPYRPGGGPYATLEDAQRGIEMKLKRDT
jgi:hypothetical protein